MSTDQVTYPYGYAQEQPPVYPQAPVKQPGNGLALAAIIVGIVGALVAIIPFVGFVGAVAGLVAVGLGIAGIVRARKVNKGLALAIVGLVAGLAATPIAIVTTVAATAVVVEAVDEAVDEAIVQAEDDVAIGKVSADVDGDAVIEVTVTNSADVARTYTFGVVATTLDGSVVAETYFVTAEIGPGQSQTLSELFVDGNYEFVDPAVLNGCEFNVTDMFAV